MEQRMPLARYFYFVGGVLLALLFILDATLQKFPVVEQTKANPPVIRIYSDRKWPERIVYDTSARTIVPTSIVRAEGIVHTPEMIADASARATEREAFAMLPSSADQLPVSNTKTRELKPRHQNKIARKRAPAPRIAMARHLQFGWFGRNFW
jgi:hypothetical protein